MNLRQSEKLAQESDLFNAKFVMTTNMGDFEMTWLDPWMGCLKLKDIEGFMTIRSLEEKFPEATCGELYE